MPVIDPRIAREQRIAQQTSRRAARSRIRSKRAPQAKGFGKIGKYVSGTGKGLYHGITGIPTAAYMTGRAVGKDTYDLGRHPLRRPFRRTTKLGKNIAIGEYNAWRNVGKGGDLSAPIFDVLALLSAGGGAAARLGAGSRALKAARDLQKGKVNPMHAAVHEAERGMGKKMSPTQLKRYGVTRKEVTAFEQKYGRLQAERTNTKSFIKRTKGGANLNKAYNARQAARAFGREAMKQPTYNRRLKGGYLDVPTSPNPLFRTLRKGREKVRSKESAQRELLKEIRTRERFAENMGIGINKRTSRRLENISKNESRLPGELEQAIEASSGAIGKTIGIPMALLRMGMWSRPRYYLQNMVQTGQLFGTHPIRTVKSTKDAIKHPKEAEMFRKALGEAQAGSIAEGLESGRMAGIAAKKLRGKRITGKRVRLAESFEKRGIQGTVGHAANIPESHIRKLSAFNEFRRMGLDSPEKIQAAIQDIKVKGVTSKYFVPLRRAEEEMGAFGRIFQGERQFMRTQIPIFYPMFKALTRLGVRFPSEHSIASAALLSAGKEGKKEQNRLLGDLPFWAQYLIPTQAGDPNAKRGTSAVLNPANIYSLQPAADVGKQITQPFRLGGPIPGLNLLQESGPLPQLLTAMQTGKDIQTGYPLIRKGMPDWQRRAIVAASLDYLRGLPWASTVTSAAGLSPHLRSYKKGDLLDALNQELWGPGFIPRMPIHKELNKQAKREGKFGRTKRRRRKYRSRSGGF